MSTHSNAEIFQAASKLVFQEFGVIQWLPAAISFALKIPG